MRQQYILILVFIVMAATSLNIINAAPGNGPAFPAPNAETDADGEYVRIKIKPFYRDTILKDPFLMEGNLEVYAIGGRDYMISVGAAEIDGTGPSARINARTVAEAVAHNQMVTFIHGVKVSNETVIKSNTVKTKSMKKARGKATAETLRKLEKHIQNIVIQESYGRLPGTDRVGYWMSADRKTLFAAVVYPLPAGNR